MKNCLVQDASIRTDLTTIVSILSPRTESLKTFQPRRGVRFDLSVVRVETAGPFPALHGVGYVVPIGHGRLLEIKVRRDCKRTRTLGVRHS